jgi:hypothetical protein
MFLGFQDCWYLLLSWNRSRRCLFFSCIDSLKCLKYATLPFNLQRMGILAFVWSWFVEWWGLAWLWIWAHTIAIKWFSISDADRLVVMCVFIFRNKTNRIWMARFRHAIFLFTIIFYHFPPSFIKTIALYSVWE